MLETAPSRSRTACPDCGRVNDGETLVCPMCGLVLRRSRAAAGTPATAAVFPVAEPAAGAPKSEKAASSPKAEEAASSKEPWIYLAIGAVTAPIFALTPILGFMGWFLASLVHEMGHSAVAWFFGMPAFPAISLEGHAVSVHSEPIVVFAIFVGAGLAGAAWKLLEGRARWIALGIVGVVYPLLAFTDAKEVLHLLGGHGGELAFGALAIWKCLDGGFTESRLERALYGTVGWYLIGTNAKLCLGLMFSASSREWYGENGSFGLTNDMIRAAEDVLHWRLQSVAFLMLVATVAALAAAFGLWRISSREEVPG
jgi:hypothetical protein